MSTTDEAVALWDPCTGVGEDVLRQVGVDPSTRDNTISGAANVPGWKLCSWKDKPVRSNHTLGVWSTTHTVEALKQDSNNIDFTNVSVAGRSVVEFRKAHDDDRSECYLALPTRDQTIEISVYKSTLSQDGRETCAIAVAAAEALVPILPQ